jgi:D-arabinose 1-dehydrogenase-like Zn-dependent alcohol dehydrogenase
MIIGETYFAVMKANVVFINVNAPTWKFPELDPLALLMNQVVVCGSAAGAPHHFEEMFAFAVENNVCIMHILIVREK